MTIVYKFDPSLLYPGVRLKKFDDWFEIREVLYQPNSIADVWKLPLCRFATMDDFHDSTTRTKKESQRLFDQGVADLATGFVTTFSTKARELLSSTMEPYGEFLPIDVEGDRDSFFIYHCTNMADVVDLSKCDPLYNDDGKIISIHRPAFFKTKVKRNPVFRIKDVPRNSHFFFVDRLKKQIEVLPLKGLEFKEVWRSSDEPPLPTKKKGTSRGR